MAWNPKIEVISGDIHRDLLRVAYRHAWNNSDDLQTKTGAVIADRNLDRILALGTNHIVKGMEASEEQLLDRNWKYEHVIHAEAAAVYSAAKAGECTRGAVMYMPWVPCLPCAKSLIDAGISMFVGHKEQIFKTTERWHASTDYALKVMEKAGVKVLMYDGKIGGADALFDGVRWQP